MSPARPPALERIEAAVRTILREQGVERLARHLERASGMRPPNGPPRTVPQERIAEAVELRKAGRRFAEIQGITGLSTGSLSRALKGVEPEVQVAPPAVAPPAAKSPPGSPGPPEEVRSRVIELRDEGHGYNRIAAILDLSREQVARIVGGRLKPAPMSLPPPGPQRDALVLSLIERGVTTDEAMLRTGLGRDELTALCRRLAAERRPEARPPRRQPEPDTRAELERIRGLSDPSRRPATPLNPH